MKRRVSKSSYVVNANDYAIGGYNDKIIMGALMMMRQK